MEASLVIYPNTNSFCKYIGRVIDGYGPDVVGFYRFNNPLFMNILRLLSLYKIQLPNWATYGKWARKKKQYTTILLFAELASIDVIRTISLQHPLARKILYFWNIDNCSSLQSLLDKEGWEIWTFDKQQATEYGWNYVCQFYGKDSDLIHDNQNTYNFCFCGYNKHRASQLLSLASIFKKNGLNYKFYIREWGIKNYFNSLLIKSLRPYVSLFETDYRSYLKLVAKTDCLIEIVQKGQEGLTMRTMESLFYEKKLLTNNVNILKYEFYDHANIFVLGIDNLDYLKDWLSIPYNSSVSRFCKDYSVKAWYSGMNIPVEKAE